MGGLSSLLDGSQHVCSKLTKIFNSEDNSISRTTHIDEEGHAHYLTFSCYKGYKLFRYDTVCNLFIEALSNARSKYEFKLLAFVIMPTHVHMLVFPEYETTVKTIVYGIKKRFSHYALNFLESENPELYAKLHKKRGAETRRKFWQAGSGYDRNIFNPDAIRNAVTYIHNNPVRAGLVEDTVAWKMVKCQLLGIG